MTEQDTTPSPAYRPGERVTVWIAYMSPCNAIIRRLDKLREGEQWYLCTMSGMFGAEHTVSMPEDWITRPGETPPGMPPQREMNAEQLKRAASAARAMQIAVEMFMSLRPSGRGHCLCGGEGDLYTLAGTSPPDKRCIDCWQEYYGASRQQ